MKKKRFTPQQISTILKEYENGKSVEEIGRDHGVSRASFYKWRQPRSRAIASRGLSTGIIKEFSNFRHS